MTVQYCVSHIPPKTCTPIFCIVLFAAIDFLSLLYSKSICLVRQALVIYEEKTKFDFLTFVLIKMAEHFHVTGMVV